MFEGMRLLDKQYYNGQMIEVGHVLQGVGILTRKHLQERVELSSEVRPSLSSGSLRRPRQSPAHSCRVVSVPMRHLCLTAAAVILDQIGTLLLTEYLGLQKQKFTK